MMENEVGFYLDSSLPYFLFFKIKTNVNDKVAKYFDPINTIETSIIFHAF
jgi:hypothetical protein